MLIIPHVVTYIWRLFQGKKSIFLQRHRLIVRRELLSKIVARASEDRELLDDIDAAFHDQAPRCSSVSGQILVRYCYYLNQYIHEDWIAPISPLLLKRLIGTSDTRTVNNLQNE